MKQVKLLLMGSETPSDGYRGFPCYVGFELVTLTHISLDSLASCLEKRLADGPR